jgi:hypothetical protein
VQVALDGADRTLERLGQGFHLGVALACSVIGVIRQSTVGRDDLSRNTGGYQLLCLWNPGKARPCHSSPFCGGCALADSVIESAKAAGSCPKGVVPPLFLFRCQQEAA